MSDDDLDARVAQERGPDVGSEWVPESAWTPPLAPPLATRDVPVAVAPVGGTKSSPLPAPASAPASARPLDLRAVTYADLDRLWDWIRADVEGATRFLGAMPEHSQALFAWFQKLLDAERSGHALVRAIDGITAVNGLPSPMHIGFIMLNPLNRATTPAIGQVHCYLSPSVQGSLPQLLPVLLDIAAEQEPTLTLVVGTTDYAFAKLLQPHGFHISIALTRPPRAAQG